MLRNWTVTLLLVSTGCDGCFSVRRERDRAGRPLPTPTARTSATPAFDDVPEEARVDSAPAAPAPAPAPTPAPVPSADAPPPIVAPAASASAAAPAAQPPDAPDAPPPPPIAPPGTRLRDLRPFKGGDFKFAPKHPIGGAFPTQLNNGMKRLPDSE